MTNEEIIKWVRFMIGDIPEEECLERYEIYRQYRDEGQSNIVSLQYAGLI